MSTRAEYSLLVPRPASLAGWVPVSLLWAMLGWVSRKQAWSEQLIHDYTIRESVPLAANRDISTFATEKPCFTLRQQPLGWVWKQNACLLHHLSQGHHCPCHITACSQLVRFSLSTAKLYSHILSASRGPTGCADPLTPRGLSGEGALCPSPLRQLSQGYQTLHLIVLNSLRGGDDTEPIKIWVPKGLNYILYLFWNC